VGIIRNFSGVDTSAPVDGHAGATESSASTTHVAPSVNANYANEMRVVGIADASNGTCNTISGWNLTSGFTSGGSGATQVNGSMFYSTTSPAVGATGTVTATCGNDIAATHQLTLKPSLTPSCTVTTTLSKVTPMTLRASTTKTVVSGTSIVMDTPAGTQQNDLMIVSIGYTGNGSVTAAAGWTGVTTWPFGQPAISLNTYRRIAGSSEPASYTWTVSATAAIVGWQGSYIGGDTASPLDAIGNNTNTTGTTHATGSLTTTRANDLILGIYALNATATFSTPTGMSAEGTATGATGITLAVFDATQPTIGTYGPKTSTSSVSGTGATNLPSFKSGVASVTTLGSATTTLGSISSPTLRTVSIPTSAATFAAGDRLQLDVSVPNDAANCGVRLSYDEAGTPSKLTVATIVPEGVAGLLLLAPALPFGARWWKRRR